MTVYEMIQELSKHNATDEVIFKADIEFDCDVEVDLEGKETQCVTPHFEDNVTLDEICGGLYLDREVIVKVRY